MISWCRYKKNDWATAIKADWATARICFVADWEVTIEAVHLFSPTVSTSIDSTAPVTHLFVSRGPTSLFDPRTASFIALPPAASQIDAGAV